MLLCFGFRYYFSILVEFKSVMKSIIILTNCKKAPNFVWENVEKLKLGFRPDFWNVQFEENRWKHQSESDFLDILKNLDKKQELHSKFYFHFNQNIRIFLHLKHISNI